MMSTPRGPVRFPAFRSQLRQLSVFVALTAMPLTPTVNAAVHQWTNDQGGLYFDTANWDTGIVPNGSSEDAEFIEPATYTVDLGFGTVPSVGRFDVLDGDVTLTGSSTILTVHDVVNVNSADWTLGEPSTGVLLSVLNQLDVDNGGTMRVVGASQAAFATGAGLSVGGEFATSTLTVDGANASLSARGPFQVNRNGRVEAINGSMITAPAGTVSVGNSNQGGRLRVDSGATFTTFDTATSGWGTVELGLGGITFNGFVDVFGGGQFETGHLIADNFSRIVIDGANSRLEAVLSMQLIDSADVFVQNQGQLELPTPLSSAYEVSGNATIAIEDSGSKMRFNRLTVADQGFGVPRISVLDGAELEEVTRSAILNIANLSDSAGELIVRGAGSLVDMDESTISLGSSGHGRMEISDGGRVSTNFLSTAFASDASSTVLIDGGTLSVGFGINLNRDGTARFDVIDGGLLEVDRELSLGPNATIQISGGELRLEDLEDIEPLGGTLNWNAGTVRAKDPTRLTATVADLLLPGGGLGFGKTLVFDDPLTLAAVLRLDGGHLAVEDVVNANLLQLAAGTFEWLNSELVIDAGEVLGDRVVLNDDLTLMPQDQLTNRGDLSGGGTIAATLVNDPAGSVLVDNGNRLAVDGDAVNSGDIQVLGGRLEVAGDLDNNATGVIEGRGTLAVGGTLNNSGNVRFSAGFSDVFGDVANTGQGVLMSTGGATVTYYDNVDHNGAEIRTGHNSLTVFIGDVTGSGDYTGPGTPVYEGNFSPGNSPGLVEFAGDLWLASTSTLEIELAGLLPGSEYDQLRVDGTATIEGVLEVSLLGEGIDMFTPQLGDQFEILSAGNFVGEFRAAVLPELLSGLAWNLEYTSTAVLLSVASGLAADFDGDGDVDGEDFLIWQTGFGIATGAAQADGDANQDGAVDGEDFLVWQADFGTTVGSGGYASRAVPEPQTLVLLAVFASLGLIGRRSIL